MVLRYYCNPQIFFGFEQAAINAERIKYRPKNQKISACKFHLCQSLMRRIDGEKAFRSSCRDEESSDNGNNTHKYISHRLSKILGVPCQEAFLQV